MTQTQYTVGNYIFQPRNRAGRWMRRLARSVENDMRWIIYPMLALTFTSVILGAIAYRTMLDMQMARTEFIRETRTMTDNAVARIIATSKSVIKENRKEAEDLLGAMANTVNLTEYARDTMKEIKAAQ